MIPRLTRLLPLFLALTPALVHAQGEGSDANTEAPPVQELVLPETTESALQMRRDLEELSAERPIAQLESLLTRWMTIARNQSVALETALAAPEGTPDHDAALALRADLDSLLAGADVISEALAKAGGDVEGARADIAALRPDDAAAIESSTVPANRQIALELPIEVLRAQLRPLRREQVAAQLEQWLEFLQKTCLEVRNVEVFAIQSEDAEQVEEFNARAVSLRGERAALIKRVNAVIHALDRKGGDVAEARDYVDSVTINPPITGWRAASATTRAWLTDKEGGIALARKAIVAFVIFMGFWLLSKLLASVARRGTSRLPRASELLREFITSSIRRLTILIGLLVALSTLGLNMTPLVAAIGAAGLVIGLALQGTLGNLASGLMIMVYRPFDVTDLVTMAGVTGRVEGMNLMTTAVKTADNQRIHVPNNKIWGDVITNVTANITRRVDLTFGIGYGDDISLAKTILERIVKKHEKVLADPAPLIRVHTLGDSSVNLIVRPWAKTEDYWEVYWDVTEEVKRTFDAEGISIPFPQRDVHLIPAPEAADDTTRT